MLLAVLVGSAAGAANGGGGQVQCGPNQVLNPETGTCDLIIDLPGGDGGGDGDTVGNPGGGGGGNAEEETVCKFGAEEIPCEDDGASWDGSRLCYVSPSEPQPPQDAPVWEGNTDGAIYMCRNPFAPQSTYHFWAATDPGATGPDPEALAQQAVEQMNLQAGEIGATPNEGDPDTRMQIIGLPTWLWVDNPGPSTTGPITESVSAGGVTVSATATLDRIEYDMGDGGTVTCAGENAAGTPYESSYGDAPSPTCGYMYETTSANQPGEEFTITATSFWVVEWSGGGASGTIPLEFTQTRQQRVGEVQAIVTDG